MRMVVLPYELKRQSQSASQLWNHQLKNRGKKLSDVEELIGLDMAVRLMTVQQEHEAFVKGVAQASDGLCCVFSRGAGKLVFASPKDRAADLSALVDDLECELRSC